MATIKQVKRELKHERWAEEIAECQSSGMKINEWCQMKGISCNTYYRRLRIVRTEFLEQTEAPLQKIVLLSIAAESCEVPAFKDLQTAADNSSEKESEKVFIRKNRIEIEVPKNTEEHTLIALLKGLQQC